MKHVHRSAIVPRPAALLFELVDRVEDYPARFSWCTAAEVLSRDEHAVVARLTLRQSGFTTAFTTRNLRFPCERLELELVDGPFSALDGTWSFRPLGDDGCRVTLDLHYEVASRVLGGALSVGFRAIADRLVDDFVRAALGSS